MSARSKARKRALDLLYEADIRGVAVATLAGARFNGEASESGEATLERNGNARVLREYTNQLLVGIASNRKKIDELIITYAQGWDMDRMPVVDRNVLRIGIYEILWADDVPDSVAINEAVEMAKTLSTDESATYVNGVLGRISSIKENLTVQ